METPASESCCVGVLVIVFSLIEVSGAQACEGVFCSGGNGFGSDAEFLEQPLVVCRGTEVLKGDRTSGITDEFAPSKCKAGFDACQAACK